MSISNAPVRRLKKSYKTVTGRFFSRKLSSRFFLLIGALRLRCQEEVTLRENRLSPFASSFQPLPAAFASFDSLAMSVVRMEFVTSQRDKSKVWAPIAFRYSGT